jgi:hypothetical protein
MVGKELWRDFGSFVIGLAMRMRRVCVYMRACV